MEGGFELLKAFVTFTQQGFEDLMSKVRLLKRELDKISKSSVNVNFNSTGLNQASNAAAGAASTVNNTISTINRVSIVFNQANRRASELESTLQRISRISFAAVSFGIRGLLSSLRSAAGIARSLVSSFLRITAAGVGGILSTLTAPLNFIIEKFRLLSRVVIPGFIFGGLVFGLRQSIQEFAEFEKLVSRAAAALRLFGAENAGNFRLVRTEIRRVAIDSLFTANQVAETLEELAKGGLDDFRQALLALGPTVRLAIAGGLEPAEAATASLAALNTFARNVADLADVNDALVSAAAQSSLEVGGLVEALKAGGAAATLTNVSLEEFLALITAIAQRAPSGSIAGTAVGRAFAQVLAPEADEGRRVLEAILRRTGNRLQDFTNESVTQFTNIIGLFAALEKAGATFPDFQRIFGERGRQIGLLLGDPNDLTDGANRIRAIFEQIRRDQATNLTDLFAAMQIDSFSGALKLLSNSFAELRIAILDSIRGPLVFAIQTVRQWVLVAAAAVRSSGVWMDFLAGLAVVFQQLRDTVVPVIGLYLRLSTVFSVTAALAAAQLASIVAGQLLPAFEKLTGSVANFLGIGANPFENWRDTFIFISNLVKNFPIIFQIAVLQIKSMAFGFLADVSGRASSAFTMVFSQIGVILRQQITQFFSSDLIRIVTAGAKIIGGILYNEIDKALNQVWVNFLETGSRSTNLLRFVPGGGFLPQLLNDRQRELRATIERNQRETDQLIRESSVELGQALLSSLQVPVQSFGNPFKQFAIMAEESRNLANQLRRQLQPTSSNVADEFERARQEMERIRRQMAGLPDLGGGFLDVPQVDLGGNRVVSQTLDLLALQRQIQQPDKTTAEIRRAAADITRRQDQQLAQGRQMINALGNQGFARLS